MDLGDLDLGEPDKTTETPDQLYPPDRLDECNLNLSPHDQPSQLPDTQ